MNNPFISSEVCSLTDCLVILCDPANSGKVRRGQNAKSQISQIAISLSFFHKFTQKLIQGRVVIEHNNSAPIGIAHRL